MIIRGSGKNTEFGNTNLKEFSKISTHFINIMKDSKVKKGRKQVNERENEEIRLLFRKLIEIIK